MTTTARLTRADLRAAVVRRSLFAPTTLAEAVGRLGFVQADPIRAPARAQDLILRHRVADYRHGDLERRYPDLSVEEDFVYAYGFVPREAMGLLHPRTFRGRLPALAGRVLEFVRARGAVHPRDLVAEFGAARTINAWGGYSKATTRALELLHFRGLLRVAHRRDGTRLYAPAPTWADPVRTPAERLRGLVRLLTTVFAPLPLASLRELVKGLRRAAPGLAGCSTALAGLARRGELESAEVDGLAYVWPADERPATAARADAGQPAVRFLAPFDPVVWDRRRFEHLWDWRYRFEAYTPVAKRRLGYYALPLLWADAVIGWVNLSWEAAGPEGPAGSRLRVETGYVSGAAPRERAFRPALDEEIGRVEGFLDRTPPEPSDPGDEPGGRTRPDYPGPGPG